MAKMVWTCRIHNATFKSGFQANVHKKLWKKKGVFCAIFGKMEN